MADVETVLARGAPDELLHVPVAVSLDPPDCAWAQDVCLRLAAHPHFNVRGNAVLGFGHLARTCGVLDEARVRPLVEAALRDPHEYVPRPGRGRRGRPRALPRLDPGLAGVIRPHRPIPPPDPTLSLDSALRTLLPAVLLAMASCAGNAVPAAPPPCTLPEGALMLSPSVEYELRPGAVDSLRLFVSRFPGAFEPLPDGCRPEWSLPEGGPASLDAGSGTLRVEADAPDGTSFPLLARVGGREVRTVVRVVDPARSPLVGTWAQTGETPCGGAEAAPAEPIRELQFRRDGTFGVTWMPFESYRDYWGTYTHDAASGRLRLVVQGGNFVPADLDPEGVAEVEGGVLRLRKMWLGSRNPTGAARCGLRFERPGP